MTTGSRTSRFFHVFLQASTLNQQVYAFIATILNFNMLPYIVMYVLHGHCRLQFERIEISEVTLAKR